MSETKHANAIAQVEKALRSNGIAIAGFSGAVINATDEEVNMGGDVLPAGQYVAVEFKVIVPIPL